MALLNETDAPSLNSLPFNTLPYYSSQAFRQTQEATEMLKRTREEKMRYEEELMTIKRKSGVQEALRQRLSDSEVVQYKHLTSVHFVDIWVYLRNLPVVSTSLGICSLPSKMFAAKIFLNACNFFKKMKPTFVNRTTSNSQNLLYSRRNANRWRRRCIAYRSWNAVRKN